MSNKDRLFELMNKVGGMIISEAKMYLKPNEVPQQIISWAKSIIGSGFERNITITKVEDKYEISIPWHESDRETHKFFKLTPNGAEDVGNGVSRSGWGEVNNLDKYGKVEIPSGYVLVTVGTYPKRLNISVNKDATDFLPPKNDILSNLSDDAVVALYQAKGLKPAYRQKFSDTVYSELINKGLMNSMKAITVDGKNLISPDDGEHRIKTIRDEDERINGFLRKKYKLY